MGRRRTTSRAVPDLVLELTSEPTSPRLIRGTFWEHDESRKPNLQPRVFHDAPGGVARLQNVGSWRVVRRLYRGNLSVVQNPTGTRRQPYSQTVRAPAVDASSRGSARNRHFLEGGSQR